MDIRANCSTAYRAAHTSGTRSLDDVSLIVLHDEEAGSAEAAARWFASPYSQGSAHLCVDETICYRTLNNEDIPWAAHGANENGFHIEQAGFARWSAVVWLSHLRTLQRAAYKTAFHCRVFAIPVVWLDYRKLQLGYKGITTHAECTRAFGGTHTDPGPFWPRRYFMRLVRGYIAELDV